MKNKHNDNKKFSSKYVSRFLNLNFNFNENKKS